MVYVGDDDITACVYNGHPGRVIDRGQYPTEVAVGFVNGPSLCVPLEQLRALSEEEYLQRGRRLVALMHPVLDVPVHRFNDEGDEWVDGGEPSER